MTRVAFFVLLGATLTAQTPAVFDTPDAAAKALTEAAKGGRSALLTLFGESASDLFPEMETAEMAGRFVDAAGVALDVFVDPTTRGFAQIEVGESQWEFPIPLVRSPSGWRFDVALGRLEVLARRIGTNELAAIEALRAVVDLQQEYTRLDRDGDGLLEYALRVISTPGKQDGLFPPDMDNSVIREFAASMGPPGKATPFRGYYFKGLTRQGPDAPGGSVSYLVDGNLIGYAMLAWPAEYGVSGVRSFLVSFDGAVFEKDLGPATPKLAAAITQFNPDGTWLPVTDGEFDEDPEP
jgi:hypothetical protein